MSGLQGKVAWAPTPAHSVGLVGLVDAITLGATRLGRAVDPAIALGLSGVAFRHYLLHPADNHAFDTVYPGVSWTSTSLSIDNFGAIESLAPMFSLDIRRWIRPSSLDAAALLKLELEAGRLVGARAGDDAPWSSIVRFTVAGREFDDLVSRALAGPDVAGTSIEIKADHAWTGPELLSVRVGPDVPEGRRHAIQRELLSFVHQHAHTGHEIGTGTDFVFASGLRAWRLLADLAERSSGDESLTEAVGRHLAELAASRAGAPALFAAWSEGLAGGDSWWADVPGGAAALGAAARAWRDVAEATAAACAAVGTPLLHGAVRRIEQLEATAISLVPRSSGLF